MTLPDIKAFAQRHALLAVVFFTGAAVLIVEVVATRLLAPYFGNTIFTVSSVIGVILAALSAGYYLGGLLADRRPYTSFFYALILAGGVSVLLLQTLVVHLLPYASSKLSIMSGPPVMSTILFFLPGFLLGMLSPYAIKLQKERVPKKGIGTISGQVFFWSTLGSIAGTFLAGFYLIPNFGLRNIIITIALSLTGLGLIGYINNRRGSGAFFLLPWLLGLFGAVLLVYTRPQPRPAEILYDQEGIYDRLVVAESRKDGYRTRYLWMNSGLAGSVRYEPEWTASPYIYFYALHQPFKPKLKNALVIGGGAYLAPRLLLKDSPQTQIDVAEIEPSLLELSQQYFGLPKNPAHLNNHVEDGRRFLDQTEKKYDLIFSDAYFSYYSVPSHLLTREFFRLARGRLTPNGVFVANVVGPLGAKGPSLTLSAIKTFRSVFPHRYFFAVRSPDRPGSQNVIFVGVNNEGQSGLPAEETAKLERRFPALAPLAEKLIDEKRLNLKDQLTLTDDYAPTEYLTARALAGRIRR